MKILVVDDSEMSLKLLEASFKKAGFEVFTAVNGYEALTISKTHTIDIIVSDLNMPFMDGFTLEKKIRGGDRTTPFLLYTSKGATPDLVQLAKKAGIELIGGSNLEEILGTVLQKFERSIRENKLKHESL